MKKILYITTISDTINAFLIPHIKYLTQQGYKVDCAANIVETVNLELKELDVKFYDIPFNRNPLSINNITAYRKLVKIQENNHYDIVHVHTPVASLYGRFLKIRFNKIKTIYTVHGFHFYKGASIKNWVIYYSIERLMSKLTDSIVTINKEDYKRASDFKVRKVYKIDGVGIDIDFYRKYLMDSKNERKILNLDENDFIILMIAEINSNKNHIQMIKAIKILRSKGINIKVLCAGDGEDFEGVKEVIKNECLEKNIEMLGNRTDINRLVSCCNIGILMSYREGLPRNIMELMACGKPVIGTDVRGIRDLIQSGKNGFLVDIDDCLATANAIETLYKDKNLLDKMGNYAFKSVQTYSIENVINQLKEVY